MRDRNYSTIILQATGLLDDSLNCEWVSVGPTAPIVNWAVLFGGWVGRWTRGWVHRASSKVEPPLDLLHHLNTNTCYNFPHRTTLFVLSSRLSSHFSSICIPSECGRANVCITICLPAGYTL